MTPDRHGPLAQDAGGAERDPAPGDPAIPGEPGAPIEGARIGPGSIGSLTLSRRRDRWAHRRGEPRLFVLLWTTYLFSTTLLTLVAVSASNALTVDAYRPAARLLIASVAVGVSVLWPMVRLSQVLPARGGVVPSLQDVVIVVLPAQAVIWPQWMLAGLPPSVIGAAAAVVAAWALVVGGLLAHALTARPRAYGAAEDGTPGSPGARTGWMIAFVVIALGGGVAVLGAGVAGSPAPPVRPLWMLSPITGVLEVTADRSWMGVPARVAPGHWGAIGLTAGAAAVIWALAAARGRGRGRPDRLH